MDFPDVFGKFARRQKDALTVLRELIRFDVDTKLSPGSYDDTLKVSKHRRIKGISTTER